MSYRQDPQNKAIVSIADSGGNPLTSTSGSLNVNVTNGGGGGPTSTNITEIGGNAVTTTLPVSGTISISGTVPVSGTFYQATQPVSIATMPSTPVTGTFWQTTQPISGSVSVSNFPATQPVSGTVTSNIGTTNGLALDSSLSTINTTLGTPFQASGSIGNTKFGIDVGGSTIDPRSIRALTSSDQITIANSSIAVTGTFYQSVQPISATSLPLPTLAATSTKQSDGSQKTQIVDGSGNVIASTSNALNVDVTNSSIAVTGTFYQSIQPISIDQTSTHNNVQLVSGSTTTVTQGTGTNLHTVLDSGTLTSITNAVTVSQGTGSNLHTVLDSGTLTSITNAVTVSQGTGSNLHTVLDSGTLTSITNAVTTNSGTSSTSSLTNVASSASTTQLLASNSGRKMAIIFNDSTQILYVNFGNSASTSAYTVQIPSKGYFEFPVPVYTGVVNGIWTSANGNARITELT
jgi:hypothetical protein